MTAFRQILLLAAAMPAFAQVRFEVASIRRADPDATAQTARMNFGPNRFDAGGVTVYDLLYMMQGFRLYRIQGGPAWLQTDRYNIAAKMEERLPDDERAPAVMALLEERFHLTVHKEMRDLPTIVLLVPKAPTGLKAAGSDEIPRITSASTAITFTAWTMRSLTNYLSQMFQSAVEDQTGLTGRYNFSLEVPPASPGEAWSDRLRAAVTTFGFRLESRKIPTEMTIVDRCERPSEN